MVKATRQISVNQMHRIGYVYWIGFKDKHFTILMNKKELRRAIKKKLQYGKSLSIFWSCCCKCIHGWKEKSIRNLRIWTKSLFVHVYVTLIKNDPLFDNIKRTEFQQIVRMWNKISGRAWESKEMAEETGIQDKQSQYEVISSHTARRTFITICLQKGSPSRIDKDERHSDFNSMRPYIKIAERI